MEAIDTRAKKGIRVYLERRGFEILEEGCVLSSSRRQNRRYDFDTFGVSHADRYCYS